jgi:hypothetical protein
MSGNGMLKRISPVNRNEVTGEWRNLHNELHDLHSSPNIIRMIKSDIIMWTRHVACMGEIINSYKILVGNPEEKRPLGRPKCRWEDNIKIVLKETGHNGADWIHVA